jgi:YVTN family beta-propeller protein
MNLRNNIKVKLLAVIIFISTWNVLPQNALNLQKVGLQPDGSILVPSNQLLKPAGFQVQLPGRPVDLAITPDEKLLIVKNMGSLDIIRLSERTVLQSLPFPKSGASFTGICLSGDGKRIYVTDAEDCVHMALFDAQGILHWGEPIVMPEPSIGGNPVPGGLVLSKREDKIYVALSRSNSLAIITLADTSIIEIPAGIAPYEVILLSAEKAYVSNWGGRRPHPGESVYNTSGSKVLVDPKTGIANNGSISVLDLKQNKNRKDITVGLHPSGMALSPDRTRLFVACANSDLITVINTHTDEVTEEISVHRKNNLPFGSAPNALTVSPDGKYLYVANGTDNAICVIQIGTPSQVKGYIPTGWYPGSVITDRPGKFLFVANVKGVGSRNQKPGRPGHNSHDHLGTISIIPTPTPRALNEMTETVNHNNSFLQIPEANPAVNIRDKVAVPQLPGQTSFIKHVVYIIKENRTYDQVFGDMTQGNGDTSLLEFGRKITPNHHLLAETFVLLDNYYCSGVLSADGHQWTDEAYVTDYIEKFFGDFTRSYPYDGNDALAYASSGFIWDKVLSHGLTFRNYGEFVDAVIEPDSAGFTDIYQDFTRGTHKISIRAKTNLGQLEPYNCPTYIGFPNKVPDVYRAAEFIKELNGFEKTNNFPDFIIMLLPNDHTSGTEPGMPTPGAAVADNDLALGQIVEAISKSKFWKETCIFVTEDDPQAGLDHVDGHRTVGMVISPYTRSGKVISTYYSQINMVRTMENIMGIPPMNQLDLASEPMVDCFSSAPDYTPYKAVINKVSLEEVNPPLSVLKGDALYWARKSMEQDLDGVDRIDEDAFNRIIWHAMKGYDRPYPDFSRK